jgi:methylmalonyl-CoA mutase
METLPRTDFPPTDKAAWLAQVQKELKDPSAYESMRWHTDEGFSVEPYYTADDLTTGFNGDSWMEANQQAQKSLPGWLNAPGYTLTNDAPADNSRLHYALARGADALVLTLNQEVDQATVQYLSRLLNGIKLSDTPVFFGLAAADPAAFVTALKTVAPYKLKGGLLPDMCISTVEATRLTADSPQFRTVYASSHAFHNAGATATQELAFLLATLTDTYDTLTDAGLTIDQLIPKTILSVSIGTSYFMEIAKLRALRVLLSRFLAAYSSAFGIQHSIFDIRYSFFIHAQTSAFYEAAATPYTNLLRGTTEAMAAIVGGCDALTVRPYDAVRDKQQSAAEQEFSQRIARNVSILLAEESYFDKVADPSAGSYYVETLTQQLAENAWALFLDVEQRGGFARAFASGFVADEIEQSYRAKVDAVQQGRVLVGVTKFRHDEASNESIATVPRHTTDLLPNRRLAEEFE